MDANKRFAELAGLCWHDFIESMQTDYGYCRHCRKHRQEVESNPDFTDAREVIEVMENHPKGKLFFASLIYESNYEAIDDDGYIPRELVRDRTGKLRDLAIEWMEKGKENEGPSDDDYKWATYDCSDAVTGCGDK